MSLPLVRSITEKKPFFADCYLLQLGCHWAVITDDCWWHHSRFCLYNSH
jgi:hypothetical protein